jgi:hypothetical protein
MDKASLFFLLALACSAKSENIYQGEPKEVSSFSLRRNTIWSSPNQTGSHFVLVDSEVVRMMDQAGDEVWGRRLSIGSLRSAVFCSKGVVVLGETGGAFLTEDGLLQSWPFFVGVPAQWATAGLRGECLFDTSKDTVGSWKNGDSWFASDGKQVIESNHRTLSANSWKAPINCKTTCPISIWGEKIAVAESVSETTNTTKIAFFSRKDGSRTEAEIALGEGEIVSVSSAGNALVLSRDDGSVQVWQGKP